MEKSNLAHKFNFVCNHWPPNLRWPSINFEFLFQCGLAAHVRPSKSILAKLLPISTNSWHETTGQRPLMILRLSRLNSVTYDLENLLITSIISEGDQRPGGWALRLSWILVERTSSSHVSPPAHWRNAFVSYKMAMQIHKLVLQICELIYIIFCGLNASSLVARRSRTITTTTLSLTDLWIR